MLNYFLKTKTASVLCLLALGISSNAQAADPLSDEAALGKKLFEDSILSINGLWSCETCHGQTKGPFGWDWGQPESFADEINAALPFATSLGATLQLGGRNAPTAGYAAFNPTFHRNSSGEYVGGQFWDGREHTLADQAEGPILNPVEQALPSEWAAVSRLKKRTSYVSAFNDLYGIDLNAIPSNWNARASANAPPEVRKAYRAMAVAIGEYEQSRTFNKFSSKYDFYLAGKARLSSAEKRGLALFNGKAKCSTCHTSTMQTDTKGGKFPPTFTNYKYYNIGVPRNAGAFYITRPDLGLAGNLTVMMNGNSSAENGKFKVPSLRNVAITPPYFHNGVIRNLTTAVHFINTRDKLSRHGTSLTPFFGAWWWPAPEVSENVNTSHTGNLGLSSRDERDIVAFLKTLTDNYRGRRSSPWTAEGQNMIDRLHPVNDMN